MIKSILTNSVEISSGIWEGASKEFPASSKGKNMRKFWDHLFILGASEGIR